MPSNAQDLVRRGRDRLHQLKTRRGPTRPVVRRRRRRIVQERFTLGDIVDAVMHFAANSREAAVVVEDLLATGRIRFESWKSMREVSRRLAWASRD